MTRKNTHYPRRSSAVERYWQLLGLALCVALSLNSHAGELRVNAPVVNVEAISGPEQLVEVCPEKPDTGLTDTLRWDLGISCSTRRVASEQISGYRVFYRWDNRIYSQVMDRDPGETIALSVSLD